jgi:tetratricopeptide (TPR) repeat protein
MPTDNAALVIFALTMGSCRRNRGIRRDHPPLAPRLHPPRIGRSRFPANRQPGWIERAEYTAKSRVCGKFYCGVGRGRDPTGAHRPKTRSMLRGMTMPRHTPSDRAPAPRRSGVRGDRRGEKPGARTVPSARIPSAAIPLLFVALAFVLYARALAFPWVSDDHVILRENPTLRRSALDTPARLLGMDYWEAIDAGGRTFALAADRNLYRPATTISYWWNARLTGVTPQGLRAGNVLLHGLAAALVALLAAAYFGSTPGLLAGAAVLLHPAGADVVGRIVGRADILVLVGLAGFLLVARPAPEGRWSIGRGLAALGLAFVAFGAKETGLALVPLALAQAWMAPAGTPARARWNGAALAALAAAVFLAARVAVAGWPRYVPEPGHDLLTNPLAGASFAERLPAALSLVLYYVKMLVAPWPLLTLDRPATLPTWSSADTWAGLALGVLLALALIVALRRGRPWGLAPLWWLAVFALIGQLLTPIGTYREVRLVYPLLGSLALAVAALAAWPGAGGRPRIPVALFAIPLAAWGGLAWTRSADYASEIRLYEADRRHAPESPMTHVMLGVVYGEAGRPDDARRAREEALRLAPESPQALNEVAAVEIQAGNFDRADALLARALAVAPDNPVALMNLGNLRAQQERLEEGYVLLLRAEELDPSSQLTQVNLALVEALTRRTEQALARAAAIERQTPGHPSVPLIHRAIEAMR